MKLVPADGPLLGQILDQSHALWADGLSRHGYEQYNAAQVRTPWGARHLRRMALVGTAGDLLSSAKRYQLRVRLDGQLLDAVGIGAVFTPEAKRGRGYGRAIIEQTLEAARAEGAALAVLFSEIGITYYRRLGFSPIALHQVLLSLVEKPGAPMVLVRAGEDRDVPAVAALAAAMQDGHRFSISPDADTIRFSLSKKRLLAGLSPPGALTVEFFIVEEGASAVAFAVLTTAGDDVVLEMCGDRDPTGARVGALLQVLRARTPAEAAVKFRGTLPPRWKPPQVNVLATANSPDVLMVRPLQTGVLTRPLGEDEVLFWHGDLF